MSAPITITLPYPISANRYWRVFMPKGFKAPVTAISTEAKDYKAEVGWLCKAAGIRTPITGRVCIDVQLYPHRPQDWQTRMRKQGDAWSDSVQCIDLDNANKVLLDSLKGIAIDDDKWVRKIVSERMEPDAHGARVVVTITPIATASPQPMLDLSLPDAAANMAAAVATNRVQEPF